VNRCAEADGSGPEGRRLGPRGVGVSEIRRLKEVEDENRRLKHMVADLSLDKEALKAVNRKNGWSL
jgi:hypothetical protein